MGVQLIDTDFHGPLEPGTVGLLLGCSSSALKGLHVHPGVIDPDYTGQVKIMVESPRGIVSVSPGDRIAQLLLLPSLHDKYPSNSKERKDKGFGSTGVDSTFLALDLGQHPVLELSIENKKILGLLDTGADKSIIASKDWVKGWPIQTSDQILRGLGFAKTPDMSARLLTWKDKESHTGTIQPYVLELPISLWGRDILQSMGFHLTNEYSDMARNIMTTMGYMPGKGIGKYHQGRSSPITIQKRQGKEGLGFS